MKKLWYLFLLGLVFMLSGSRAEAAETGVESLYSDKVYRIDLDNDGIKEKIKYEYSYESVYSDDIQSYIYITINQKSYKVREGIVDILDLANGEKCIAVTDYGDSDILQIIKFYDYSNGKLKKIGEIDDGLFPHGGIDSMKSSKNVLVCVFDRCFDKIGLVSWKESYKIDKKKKKISRIGDTFKVITNIISKNRKFKVKKAFKVYTSTKLEKVAFISKKNRRMRFLRLKIPKRGSICLEIKDLASGKKGWIKIGKYDHGSLNDYFTNTFRAG